MAQSIPVFLVRAAALLLVGMLLSAMFADAHAQNMNGYGIKPAGNSAPPSYLYSPAAAANNSYDAAPVSGGYYAPMGSSVGAPLANAPIGNGFEPAPAGYVAGPPQALAPASATAPQPTEATQTSPYGYRPGDGVPLPQQPAGATQPAAQTPQQAQSAPPQSAPQTQTAQPQPYGYRPGDGVPLPQQQPVEQQQPYQPPAPPTQTAQPNPYGYRPGEGVQPVAQQPAPYQLQPAQTAQPSPYGYRSGDGMQPVA